MDFEWSESQRDILSLSGKILSTEVTEASLREVERSQSFFHTRAWSTLAHAGLLGVAIDEASGGMGHSVLDLCALLYSVGLHVAPIPALSCLAFGAWPVARFGSDEQKRRLLPEVMSGQALLTGAYEERGHPPWNTASTRATREGQDLRVTGTKICVPFAARASRIVTPVTLDGSVALVLVDPRADGVSLSAGVATHGEPVYRLELSEVRIPTQDVMVAGDQAPHALRSTLQVATVCACAITLGVCERALEITAHYVSERKQFGVPIGSFQAVRQRAADAYVDVEAIRLTTLQAAFHLDQGRDAELQCAVAKHQACEGGYRVTYAAQHLHGGMGYDVDYPLHRFYLWSKALELTLGAAPEQLGLIGKVLAERPRRIGE